MLMVAEMRHESALGSWMTAGWAPPPGSPFAGAIERIWYFEGALGTARERVFPDGTLELIVQLDMPHRPGTDGGGAPFPPLCATGIRTSAEVIEAPPGRCRVLGVRLRPQAAYALMRAPLHPFTSLTIDLHDLLGAATEELETRVRDARDGGAAVVAAAAWAGERIARGPQADATVERALQAIVADGGTASMAALEAWAGRSRARFATLFRERVGITPKRFARVVRFDRALHALAAGTSSLGEIALGCGYYDQAHFTNEFREHAGLSPSEYRRARAYPGTPNLVDDPEQNFQDAAS